MKKPKSKLTNKQIVGIITEMAIQIENLRNLVFMNEKALYEYTLFKKDKEDFIKFLEKKQEKMHDKAEKEIKDK